LSNRFFVTLIVLMAVIVGGFVFTKQKSDTKTGDGNKTAVQATSHTKGSNTTGVVLIEYGDFECPACGQYYPIVKQVYETYKDRITFQFRHFPLVQIHQNAFAASRAVEAAGKQGKFFEMHDVLYENQASWRNTNNAISFFDTYAQQLDLDMAKYKQDFASEETNDAINADMREGQNAGATSTPTFVLDGKKIENPRDLEGFNKLIEDAIKAKQTSQ
jgi:protein-disulfide isomerase